MAEQLKIVPKEAIKGELKTLTPIETIKTTSKRIGNRILRTSRQREFHSCR